MGRTDGQSVFVLASVVVTDRSVLRRLSIDGCCCRHRRFVMLGPPGSSRAVSGRRMRPSSPKMLRLLMVVAVGWQASLKPKT